MDHARKIGKRDISVPWRRTPSPRYLTCNKTSSAEEIVEEDRRLVNWRKWLKDREKHYRHYEKLTGRDRKDLLMINDVDEFRYKVEIQNLVEGVGKLPLAIDKYRGNPVFWITPGFLSNHGNPDLPSISTASTKKQLGKKPEFEHVLLPELIKQEKGLPLRKKRNLLSKNNSDYLKKHESILLDEIKLLEAKLPEMSKLSLKGEKLDRIKCERKSQIPVITIEEPNVFSPEDDENQPEVGRNNSTADDIASLMIQDREIIFDNNIPARKSIQRSMDHFEWSLIFKSMDFRLSQREIRLENRSDFAITYRWRNASLDTSFPPPTPRRSPFFFNKNKGLILPRQVLRISVWFRSPVPCTAREFWILTTEPPISHQRFMFRFWGSAILSKNYDSRKLNGFANFTNAESIEKYLNRRIRDTKIHEIIESMINNVPGNDRPSVSYNSLFLENDIFQAKNPMHHYHSVFIQELRDIYNKVTSHDSPSWSLSLIDLRSILLQIKNDDLRNETMTRFNDLCRYSLKTNLYNPIGDYKKSMVYNLLCSFVNKFESESDYVTNQIKYSQKEIVTGRASSEAPGDVSRSASIAKISQASLTTPRKKSKKINRSAKSRTSSKASISIPVNNRENVGDVLEKETTKKSPFYKEVFHVRIRDSFFESIDKICAVIDTINNLNPQK